MAALSQSGSTMKNLSICALFVILMSCRLLWAQDNPPRNGIGSVPPRVEIGPVISSAKLNAFGDTFANYYVGGGGRVTVNVHRFVAAEVESTRQPTGNPYIETKSIQASLSKVRTVRNRRVG
jgi:hypothetical protein